MPPPPKSTGAGFAAAAKVLFDSAQRAGAVQPLEQSSKQYAHQLKKIQSQSKKRGGSLGGVSYKVAEFLAAQRRPSPQIPVRSSAANDRSIAKKVPLIDLPTLVTKPPSPPTLPAKEEEAKKLSVEAPASSLLSFFTSNSAPLPDPGKMNGPIIPIAAEVEKRYPPPAEEVMITEDKPLFEVRQPSFQPTSPAVVIQPAVVAKRVESPSPARKLKPIASRSIAVERALEGEAISAVDSEAAPDSAASPPSFSVDAWEQQRERELERLQKKQSEEEERRLMLVREKEHRTLGKEWVEQRQEVLNFEADVTPAGKFLREVYYAKTVDSAFASFQKMMDAGTKAVALLPAAIAAVAFKIRQLDVAEHNLRRRMFLDLVAKSKLSDSLKRKANLSVATGTPFLEAYANLTPTEKQHMDSVITVKAARLLLYDGQWEEALTVAKESRGNFRSGSDILDLTLLRACVQLEEEPRKAVVAYATESLTEQGRMGKTAKLLIARTEAGIYRRTLLKQLAAAPDVDEVIYAELIVRSSADQTEVLLREMETRGLNAEDPMVLAAVALKKLGVDDPADVFAEIDRQVATLGVRPIHVLVAAKTAALHPTEEVAQRAAEIVLAVPAENRSRGLRKLLPVLYQHCMTQLIVELADKTNDAVPLVNLLPKAVAFVNDALIKVGRPPLNGVRVSDIGVSLDVNAGTASGKADAQVATVVADLSGLTEKMLLYAKERQWLKALDAVKGLPPAIKADASAVTLLYNCALSAAVEQPETVIQVYELMRIRNVAINPTTINTVLSSLGKSASWEEALPFFDKTPLANRDNNTYLVYFALLGRHGLWKEAIAAYDEMRQSVAKPPAAMFTLVIGSTSAHNWEATLRVFQDMLKMHGAAVKDSVAMQVIRCLEQNNKAAEIAKLEKELAKKRKKKK